MLGEDLTYNQFLFCEEYLRSFNARASFKHAYKNCKYDGSYNIMKNRKVVAYLRARLEEKKATIERLTDKMHKVLCESLDSPDKDVQLEATKQVGKLNEIQARILELERRAEDDAKSENTLIVKFEETTNDD